MQKLNLILHKKDFFKDYLDYLIKKKLGRIFIMDLLQVINNY